MNVTCQDCRSVFRVDPAKVPTTGVRARCSVCGALIRIKSVAGTPVSTDVTAASPAAVGAAPSGWGTPRAGATVTPPSVPAFGTGGPSLPPFPLPTPDAAATPIVAPTVPSLPTPTWSTELPPLVEPTPTAPTVAVPSPIEVAAQRGEATAVASEAITASEPTPMAVPAQPTPIASPATPTPAASVPAPPAAPTIVPAPPTAPVAPSVPLRPLVPPPPMSPAQLVTAAPVPAPAPAKPAAVGPDGKRVINPFLKSDPQVRAKRLARALVSDMVAYQPQKRSEALANGTLKTVFKDEIRRSYDEYVDQVGREIAESTTYFQDALNEVLAEGKPIF